MKMKVKVVKMKVKVVEVDEHNRRVRSASGNVSDLKACPKFAAPKLLAVQKPGYINP